MVIPVLFQDIHGNTQYGNADYKRKLLSKNDINRNNGQRGLPNDAHHYIKCVPFEVLVTFKRWIVLCHFFMDRLPKSPRTDISVEALQGSVISRWSCISSSDTAYHGGQQRQRKVI